MTNDMTIAASALPGRLSAVLDEVEAGGTYIVTRHGVPVATLTAVGETGALGSATAVQTAEAGVEYQAGAAFSTALQPATALARLIATPSTGAVMAIFLLDPTIVLHQREVARRASVGLRSAQIALSRLETLGLIAAERDGNRLNYRALRTQRFEELRSLMTRELGLAEVIARHLAELALPVTWAFVFGSAASGHDKLDSDIDLLVISEATDDALVEPIAAAQRELGREIDLVAYQPADFAKRRAEGNHFIVSVLTQPRFDVIGGPVDA
jgi:prevent-host-death family protein